MTAASPAPGDAQTRAGDERAVYLAEMCHQLWPGAMLAAEAPSSVASEFIVLPGMRRPRLLVPPGRRAAAAAVRRYGEPGSLRTQVAVRALSLGLRTGAGRVVLRDRRLQVLASPGTPSIESYLRDALGVDIAISMHLGAARANRKPVLQLLTSDGTTVGFAKIGINPLTSALVKAERAVLARLGGTGMRNLAVPRVLHFGSWQGLTVMVLSPLPVWQRRTSLPPGRLALAMAEVAGVTGISVEPLAAGHYWATLGQRLNSADDTDDRGRLLRALETVRSRGGSTVLRFGAWHGDWTPWNMASTRTGLLVWDWERFTTGVPLGFDVLHHWLQVQVITQKRDPRGAAAECVTRAPALLAPLKVSPAEAPLTALMYLADLAARHLVDRQAEAGAQLGPPGGWLLPALVSGIAEL